MKNKSLLEKRLGRTEVFSGKAVNFRVDSVRLPNGKTAAREFLDHPGAVAVLPVTGNGDIILVRQFRYPVGEATLEVPAGKLHGKADDPLERAKAELREETGYAASAFRFLLSFWPTPAFSNEVLHVFAASGLKAGKASPDEDEFIKAVRVPFGRTAALIRSGAIKDAKTIIALQTYQLWNERKRGVDA